MLQRAESAQRYKRHTEGGTTEPEGEPVPSAAGAQKKNKIKLIFTRGESIPLASTPASEDLTGIFGTPLLCKKATKKYHLLKRDFNLTCYPS